MLTAATRHHREQALIAQRAAAAALAIWTRYLDPDDLQASFIHAILPRLMPFLIAQQRRAAAAADSYTDTVLDEQGLSTTAAGAIVPDLFTTVASDGRELTSLLNQPVIRVKLRLLDGFTLDDALLSGQDALSRIISTQVLDAGRTADGVALVARPAAEGYVRMLTLPSCARCAVLAGRFYKWNAGFKRHPRCDCRHIPSSKHIAGDLRIDPRAAITSGKVHGLSDADLRAIRDGADVSQVVNAQRGMYTTTAYGQRVKATLEGTTGRARSVQIPRLRPETIYARAGDDRDKALELLKRFGYLAT